MDDEVSIGVLMFVAHRAMESRAITALASAGFDDITLAQARVFERVGAAGTRLTSLAEQAQVTKQTAGFLVDQLQRAGYLDRRPDPTDARAKLVHVSDRGAAAIRIAAAEVARVEAEWEQHLGPAAMRTLRRTMTRLRDVTDPYLDQR